MTYVPSKNIVETHWLGGPAYDARPVAQWHQTVIFCSLYPTYRLYFLFPFLRKNHLYLPEETLVSSGRNEHFKPK